MWLPSAHSPIESNSKGPVCSYPEPRQWTQYLYSGQAGAEESSGVEPGMATWEVGAGESRGGWLTQWECNSVMTMWVVRPPPHTHTHTSFCFRKNHDKVVADYFGDVIFMYLNKLNIIIFFKKN